MKFFDLEMSEYEISRRGVSYVQGQGPSCGSTKFTNGNDLGSCLGNVFKNYDDERCKGAVVPGQAL